MLVGILAAAPVSFTLTAAFVGKPGAWAAFEYVVVLIVTGAFGAGGSLVRELAVGASEEPPDC